MEREILNFKIGLSGTSSKKNPEFKISLNDKIFIEQSLQSAPNETEFFEFQAEVTEGKCELIIDFINKEQSDTMLDSDGKIVEDLMLNINSIEIDEIDLGQLLWTASDYKPEYPIVYKTKMEAEGNNLPESVKNCVNLGWNGRWILPFQSPFYIWLLENI